MPAKSNSESIVKDIKRMTRKKSNARRIFVPISYRQLDLSSSKPQASKQKDISLIDVVESLDSSQRGENPCQKSKRRL